MRPIISTHYKLMSAGYPRQVIAMIELFRNILTEGIAGTSGRDTPATSIVRVGPEKIADGSLVWHFLDAVKLPDLV